MRFLGVIMVFLFVQLGVAQERIDGSFAFDTDPGKKYSLYIPSGYDASVPQKTMLALHPFNPSRWDAESWCDTLIAFAETNQLLLICPDGGEDGQIDDPIDTAFTSALIDSVSAWYLIDFDKFYGMGFSWGARGIYTYGLSHGDLIKGYLPIGAAISGTSEVNETLQVNAENLPFYIVHGSSDAPATRFFPVRDSLISKGAIVETNLMSGVGHTIDFPDRNEILTTAFEWIDSVNCNQTLGFEDGHWNRNNLPISVYPNPVKSEENLVIQAELSHEEYADVVITQFDGRVLLAQNQTLVNGLNTLSISLPSGNYLLTVRIAGRGTTRSIVVSD